MLGESLTTRLARERLTAIKKFIPVRDRLREKLQQRQQAQTDFSVSSEQLFTPITSATKDVKKLTEAAIYGDIPERERAKKAPLLDTLEKIAAETGQTRAGIQQLSSDIKTQHEYERLADIDDSAPEPQPVDVTPRGISFIDKLTEGPITQIEQFQLMKPEHYKIFGNFAPQSFHSRKGFLNDEYKNSK